MAAKEVIKRIRGGAIGNVYDLRRVGKNETPVIDFSVGVTPRFKDGDEWKDGDTVWTSCTAWGRLAENIADSFEKGNIVNVEGRVTMKPGYTDKNGVERPATETVTVDEAGHDLAYCTSKQERDGRGPGGNAGSKSTPKARPAAKAPVKAAPQPVEPDFDDDDFDDDDELPF